MFYLNERQIYVVQKWRQMKTEAKRNPITAYWYLRNYVHASGELTIRSLLPSGINNHPSDRTLCTLQ